jgi:hypothetical protein
MPGDSGSLVFGTAAGQLESTFPCIGLYFAGTGAWVSQQPNPNAFTVTGLAFDIANVMTQFNLDTVCACIVRALLAAIFGQESADTSATRSSTVDAVSRAEAMMRRFRDGVLARSTVGKIIARAVAQTAPNASRVLAHDAVAFGLAVDMLEPWAKASTSLGVLRRKLDPKTVSAAEDLAERVIGLAPETEKQIAPLLDALRKSEGEPVRKLIGAYRPGPLPKVKRSEKGNAKKDNAKKGRRK